MSMKDFNGPLRWTKQLIVEDKLVISNFSVAALKLLN